MYEPPLKVSVGAPLSYSMTSLVELKDACNRAIEVHAAWKEEFKRLVAGDATVDPDAARRTDACPFGAWLASDAAAVLGEDRERIAEAHAQFHGAAGDVVDAHRHGRREAVVRSLGVYGAFTRATSRLTTLLMAARDRDEV